MTTSWTRLIATVAVLGGATLSIGHAVAAVPLTVVELYTSQGCSSCPPAEANFIGVAERPDVLALSFGVTYWNNLGWRDTFARDDFTQRQVSYERGLGREGPFTPQVVVNGDSDVVGAAKGEIEALIARQRLGDSPKVELSGGTLLLGPGRAPPSGADIWLVLFDPRTVRVPIRAGENGGRTLPQKNVVHQLSRIGKWTGVAAHFAVPTASDGLSTAILVQSPNGGPILSAARD